MSEKEQLLQELDTSHQHMRTVVEHIGQDREIYPGWTIRQVLAHLTGWDEATTASLRAYHDGGDAAIASYRGINEYNAQSVETRQELSYEQTRREWELARDALKAAIQAIPQEQWPGDLLYPWGERGALAPLIRIFIDHEREHAEEIARLAGKTG